MGERVVVVQSVVLLGLSLAMVGMLIYARGSSPVYQRVDCVRSESATGRMVCVVELRSEDETIYRAW